MAVGLKWTPLLSVGNESIDEQHKELINRIGLLLDAMMQGQGREKVGEMVNFLGDYVQTHFADEENLLREKCYPRFDEHVQLHRKFVEDFQNLRQQFEKDGPSPALLLDLQKRVVDWAIQHIGGADKVYGQFLKTRP